MNNNTAPIDPMEFWAFDSALPRETPSVDRDTENPLKLVPATRSKARSSVLYALVSLTTLGVILGVQLLLSIAQADGAYQISALQVQERDLGRAGLVAAQEVEKLSSPQHLSENAAALGMVVNAHPAYLRLSDSAILGTLGGSTAQPDINRIANSLLADTPLAGAEGQVSVAAAQAAEAAAAQAAAEQATREQAAQEAAAAAQAAGEPGHAVVPQTEAPSQGAASSSPGERGNGGSPVSPPAQTPSQAVPLKGSLPAPVTR
ncbi:hypothetical protein [Lysinibacter sp. HNR]|uniref:hypothetical protein n=1 Tax=Lysinibacter sp. HNR TaxID=3031408 RepID=UPI0024358672|nr:hypothetical protein [Lysinibacter sp. HNR]WGD36475.1 hypothetical protein FrondiHNR_08285 [Lysinibacter sp. HNR]